MPDVTAHPVLGKRLSIAATIAVVFSAAAIFTCIEAVKAQATGGSISGTVTREAGNIMPGVRVSLADQAKTIAREMTTDTNGVYNFPALPPAVYQITISSPGFTTQVWSSIMVGVGTERVLNVVMKPGDPKTVVRSAAPATPISQASGCCGGTVNSSTVRETPLNGRDWAQLVTLQAGVTGVQEGTPTAGGNTDRGFGAPVSISGARPDQNSYRLDGISINDYANGAPGSVLGDNLGVDAVEQISVLGSNYPADYGRTSGGVINAVTRSGTNAFHGTVYEFLRNSAFDARNFFDAQIPPFKRNQFGGSAGLPLQKDRTYIFGDYEGLRQSLGLTTVDTVPSAAARTGQLSTGGVTVDPAVGRFLNAFYPLPNGPLLGGGDIGIYSFAAQQVTTENYFTLRFDHKFSDRDSFYGTYMRDASETVLPNDFGELFSNVVSGRQVATLHEQHLFNSNILNAVRIGYNRAVGVVGGVSQVVNPLMRDPSYGFTPGGFAGIVRQVPGVTQFLGGPTAQGMLSSSRRVYWNSFQGAEDLFITHGAHLLKFGVVAERMQDNELNLSNVNGTFRFDSLTAFLTNRPAAFSGLVSSDVPEFGTRQTLFGAYAEDDIRVQKTLTLNAGLRYEFVTVPSEAHNRLSHLDSLTAAQPSLGTPLFRNPTLRNFEPRLGFAWNPRGGDTLVRGGFGIFDVLPLPYEFTLSFQGAAPYVGRIIANRVPAGAFPTAAFQQFSTQPNSSFAYYAEPNPKRDYVMQWNLSVARELSSTMAVTLGYVGSRGVHQPYRVDNIDMVLPTLTSSGYVFPLPTGSQTLNPNFGRIGATLWQADSFYDALQADIAKRVSHGFQFHAAYTWEKSIDTLSATEANDAFPNGLFNQLFFDSRTTRGLSDFDVPQIFVLNVTWDIPQARANSHLVGWAAQGWELVGLYKASSGQPFTPILGGDPAGTKLDQTGEVPNFVSGPSCQRPVNSGNPNNYIKTQCLVMPQAPDMAFYSTYCDPAFAYPTCGNLRGNLGRNTLIGPGISNLDLSILKNNYVKRVSESFNVQFRAEFFNIMNRANFSSPTNNLAVFDETGQAIPSAGLITSTQTTSRQIQFALKLLW
ncbi:MAG TPA: carboxypeptidase regulatory-like domain-containing protein [Candidatus Acidoferrales bacterium]|nr:carboxypeptidase regulatory-like domain-containing protein [Candidatus Acidoferrales bacterium]